MRLKKILKFRFPRGTKQTTLAGKMRGILLSLAIPLIICMLVLLVMFGYYAYRYSNIMHNVNESSAFNHEFKENIDLRMYHYVVNTKEQKELPVEDVDAALARAKSLSKTTECYESRQVIKDIQDYCNKLKKSMYMIAGTKKYDARMLLLNNNIYILTNLIQGRIMDYIYYEAGYMATIEKNMMHSIIMAIAIGGILVMLLIAGILRISIQFIHKITRPVSELCSNVRKVGHGHFDIESVEAADDEIIQLDQGIQKMARRIENLLENVKREEMLQHKKELELLQAQVNPHFLYNTLDTIIWLVESDMNTEAIEMLTNFSVFFRTVLSKGADVIPLGEEIRHTKSYLDIQQVRYRDILDYEIEIPEELNAVLLPKLTLQPVVENALYHGVKEKRGKSSIRITARDMEEGICITVLDDGIGMENARLEEVRNALSQNQKLGFGMSAVDSRIRLYGGDSYGLSIESQYGKGTVVEILIPKNIQPIE